MGHTITTNVKSKSVHCDCGGKWLMAGNWVKHVLGHVY